MQSKKFLALYDLHYGFERKNGHKKALHDPKAMELAIQFANDYKPDVLILGGDILDCGAISHHNKQRPGRTDGLRILADAEGLQREFLDRLPKAPKRVYITGNHEDWLNDLQDEVPGLEGLLELPRLLDLNGWEVLKQGGEFQLGKLSFVHGDTVKGGEHVAKAAVINWERSIRFGHHHTYQVYTKTTPSNNKLGKTGMAIPCLCTKDPHYGEGAPNRWVQGINYGRVFTDGSYADQVALITNGRMVAEGKVYEV